MSKRAEARSYGRVFNGIAGEYDRHRPTYPDALIDRACEGGRLAPGARVLEIGCGTGQLTGSLLARGLRVVAVEPGEQLIARARDRLGGAGEVEFVNARFEEAPVTPARYRAVFSAAAIHWVDPDVSWRKLADALVDDGTLALVSYFGLEDSRSRGDQQGLRAALARIAPELAAQWPAYRDLDGTLAGAAQRRDNVSEVWAWLGSYAILRRYVSDLFEDVQLAALPILVEHTADALSALLGTMSFWARLSPQQRAALRAAHHALHERLGRPIRSSMVACLVTARRRSPHLTTLPEQPSQPGNTRSRRGWLDATRRSASASRPSGCPVVGKICGSSLALNLFPGSVGHVAAGLYKSPDYEPASGEIPPVGTASGIVLPQRSGLRRQSRFPKNPHTFLTNIGSAPAVAAVAVEAQTQIATFFATDGATTIDPDGPGPLFETPIGGPLPEDLGFIP